MELSPTRRDFFRTLHESPLNLARAALYIAKEEYPELLVEDYIQHLEFLGQSVKKRLPTERYPLRIIGTINDYLYGELGFSGNTADYYNPENSFLNRVLERRTGIPITLALVYLEVARRVDFPMVGVGFPGHFLIRPDLPDVEIHIDVFHNGEILFAQDCQARLAEIFQQAVPLRPEFFQAVTPQQFLIRMLSNLKRIYLEQRDLERCLGAVERILLVSPQAPDELRDRGILSYHLGRWRAARADLLDYLATRPSLEQQALIQDILRQMIDD
ncbi:transglutaminase-like domain-containing protein [Thermosynechococcaceae cyanobacterium BACA0444]|uniref:Transglutaminase-like domain-containing protein n=1 Tax=Pseudocalidococcus azoricus BACA0444 TaxID=2918990 RepID=A0AAE4FW11_9CYAN|nr:transglutaminase-like domain-containing protein [Pseudocalidococcus azoricus]MDS3862344.1 transglutaminase-like domain-containing protein [Pseudocalidococcus azoricus BACA0444]